VVPGGFCLHGVVVSSHLHTESISYLYVPKSCAQHRQEADDQNDVQEIVAAHWPVRAAPKALVLAPQLLLLGLLQQTTHAVEQRYQLRYQGKSGISDGAVAT